MWSVEKFSELSVGHDRERGVYLDPLNMVPIASDKLQPRQTKRP